MKTWLITGSSRGLGRQLVKAALDAGDQVIATARRPADLQDLVAAGGDSILTLALDVTDGEAARDVIDAGVARFGRIDVVVNNAGYANVAPIETGDEVDFRAQFETNFWGVYNVSRAAIGQLRRQGGGTVVQFSSIGGRVGGAPGIASYQAAKFAVDGFSRSLAAEVAPFGIRVLVVEPSGFATDWAGSSMTVHPMPEEYDAVVGEFNRQVRTGEAVSAGDPSRAAQVIVQVVDREHLPGHLLVGADAVDYALQYSRRQLDEAQEWAEVSRSADFGRPFPVALPPD